MIKLSLTSAGSVTRNRGEASSYGYRMYPRGLASALEECRELHVPIELTEIGIDTGISTDAEEKERIGYSDKIFQVVKKAVEEGVPVESLLLLDCKG